MRFHFYVHARWVCFQRGDRFTSKAAANVSVHNCVEACFPFSQALGGRAEVERIGSGSPVGSLGVSGSSPWRPGPSRQLDGWMVRSSGGGRDWSTVGSIMEPSNPDKDCLLLWVELCPPKERYSGPNPQNLPVNVTALGQRVFVM